MRAVFPMFLIGSYFGVIVSVSLGELILGILLMTLMAFLSCQTLWKAINLFRKESAKQQAEEGHYVAASAIEADQ